MHMPKSKKEDAATFDTIHHDEEAICDIPLCHRKDIESIYDDWYSPSDRILRLWKPKQLVCDSEHSATIDKSIDNNCIEWILRIIPEKKTQKSNTNKNLLKPSDSKWSIENRENGFSRMHESKCANQPNSRSCPSRKRWEKDKTHRKCDDEPSSKIRDSLSLKDRINIPSLNNNSKKWSNESQNGWRKKFHES